MSNLCDLGQFYAKVLSFLFSLMLSLQRLRPGEIFPLCSQRESRNACSDTSPWLLLDLPHFPRVPKPTNFTLQQWRRAWAGPYFLVEGRARRSFSKKSIRLETVGHNGDVPQNVHSVIREAVQTLMLCLQGFLAWVRWYLPGTSLSQAVQLC